MKKRKAAAQWYAARINEIESAERYAYGLDAGNVDISAIKHILEVHDFQGDTAERALQIWRAYRDTLKGGICEKEPDGQTFCMEPFSGYYVGDKCIDSYMMEEHEFPTPEFDVSEYAFVKGDLCYIHHPFGVKVDIPENCIVYISK